MNTNKIGNKNTLNNGTEHQIPDVHIITDMNENVPVHPEYKSSLKSWTEYRLTAEGGRKFIDKYLKKFSKRESETNFADRKEISYCAAHAKAALIEIKNAIYKNMSDIARIGGPKSYQADKVTRSGQTMNAFIGCEVLYELLSVGKIGVFIDREPIAENETAAESDKKSLYLYAYRAESIINWSYDSSGQLESVLLRDCNYEKDEYGLVKDEVYAYRLLNKRNGIVEVTFFDDEFKKTKDVTLKIKEIPLVIFDLGYSLLSDVSGYQIALTNLSSGDMSYALNANFPFYIEYFDPAALNTSNKGPKASGESAQNGLNRVEEPRNQIDTGPTRGRRIPKGTDAPHFIHPSAEPMLASMAKQSAMQSDIRVLLDLALTNLAANRTSAESKREDKTTKEEGLSYIGLVLEAGERRLAIIWSEYENSKDVATVKYPTDYSLSSSWDRIEEATMLLKQIPMLPSMTYQKTLAKRVAYLLVSQRVTKEQLNAIYTEIDKADIISSTPDEILADVEAGLVSHQYASEKLRQYPANEAEKAKKEHTERLAEIAKAQSQEAKPPKDPAAAGVPDLEKDKN